jgi:hypothetical protein
MELSFEALAKLGFQLDRLIKSGLNHKDLYELGVPLFLIAQKYDFTPEKWQELGYNIEELDKNHPSYRLSEVKLQLSATEFKSRGYSLATTRRYGFSDEELKEAGFIE